MGHFGPFGAKNAANVHKVHLRQQYISREAHIDPQRGISSAQRISIIPPGIYIDNYIYSLPPLAVVTEAINLRRIEPH